jgi:uncharacterized protein (DUF1800 family)
MTAIDWNEQTAAHLYRRAAFGATEDELQAAVGAGLDATVDLLLNYDAVPNDALDSRIASMKLDLLSRTGSVRMWLTRMMFTARPLQERMALFWHDHFATSVNKVYIGIVLPQIELFRRLALGSFADLCVHVAKDPAMLTWLDNYTSRKEHPNENFGRELLELFTLGRGNYAESDVQAAARAFTGWTLDEAKLTFYTYRDDWHDHDPKTFLGETGDWNGEDIVRIICSRPAHARFMAAKLFAWFAYDDAEPEVIERLADIYLNSHTDVRELVRAILTAPEMYSPRAMGTKIKSPIDFVIMAARQLGLTTDVPDAIDFLSVQGQVPYEPPNVAGWPGGRSWIGSSPLLGRMGFAERAVLDFAPGSDGAGIVDALLHRLGPLSVSAAVRQQLIDYVGGGARIRGLAQMILSLPESQMC